MPRSSSRFCQVLRHRPGRRRLASPEDCGGAEHLGCRLAAHGAGFGKAYEGTVMSGTVYVPSIEEMAAAGGVSVALIIAALRNAQVWEVIGGGPGVDPRTLSAEGKAELHAQLG